jgi:2-C-methyl-D-erythritol 4-phosphate cytidylyltransferase
MAVALIVAAGTGERLRAGRPKALVELAGRPLFAWSLEVLHAAGGIERIVLAMPSEYGNGPHDRSIAASLPPETIVVAGGATRSESVSRALVAAGCVSESELVLVHDAARPLLTVELVRATLAAVEHEGVDAAIAAAPVTDTIKRTATTFPVRRSQAIPAESTPSSSSLPTPSSTPSASSLPTPSPGSLPLVGETLDRAGLWAVQTPQVFRRSILERALDVPEDVLARATDDAWLVERIGGRVVVVPAPKENLKVTTPLDLELATLLLARRSSAAR